VKAKNDRRSRVVATVVSSGEALRSQNSGLDITCTFRAGRGRPTELNGYETLVRGRGADIKEVCPVNAIDRVMAAYRRSHKLTDLQANTIRTELSKFIDELLAERLPEPAKLDRQT
jgi:hypothetical protein